MEEEMSYEKVLEFVLLVNSQDAYKFKDWLHQNNYSKEQLTKLIGAVYCHHRNLNYLDTWAPVDDDSFAEAFREFDESLNYFRAVWEFLPEAAAGHLLKKPKKNECPADYFKPISPRIVTYLTKYHADKYDGIKWIGSAKEKVIIKELFYLIRLEFPLADYPSAHLAKIFETATGIAVSRRAFDNIKQYVKSEKSREWEYVNAKHKNFK